jgi:hypothetical protein
MRSRAVMPTPSALEARSSWGSDDAARRGERIRRRWPGRHRSYHDPRRQLLAAADVVLYDRS